MTEWTAAAKSKTSTEMSPLSALRSNKTSTEMSPLSALRSNQTSTEMSPLSALRSNKTSTEMSPLSALRSNKTSTEMSPLSALRSNKTSTEMSPLSALRSNKTSTEMSPLSALRSNKTSTEMSPLSALRSNKTSTEMSPLSALRSNKTSTEMSPLSALRSNQTSTEMSPLSALRSNKTSTEMSPLSALRSNKTSTEMSPLSALRSNQTSTEMSPLSHFMYKCVFVLSTSFMSDFDVMLARRKAMNSRKRRHRDGGTFISDADDVVSAMISKMNEAAEEDRTLNSQKKPALKKLTLLPHVVMHLKKQDLKETFIDSGVMSAIKEWISPLPDKSLPALRIREELLRILHELPSVSQETLKHSGIGRSVMFLYKHPKESRSNKDLALKLINEWSRPIFGLTSNYKGMTREERQQRDLDQQMPQKQRLSSGGQTPRRDLEKQLTGEEKALRPGDPGFCARARVPMPSNKDYVVRPKWNVEMESSRHGPMKKGVTRVDKQMRRFADIRRLTKPGHAVKISVEGNRMPL
uniref:Interacts with SUPT6H, CTD assembly factor 1 n=1 Tax=Cyclopterus lumpus TaxID=8103 RepID=A0A8C2Z0W1_CYCLU